MGKSKKQGLTKVDNLIPTGLSKNPGLTEKQRDSIPHLIGAKSIDDGCKKAGITRMTYYSWIKEPIFKGELDRVRNEIIENAILRLKGSFESAIEKFITLLDDKSSWVQLRAAEQIANYFFQNKTIEEIVSRLDRLESGLEGK